ncbi:hypothetical protein [Streptomyces pratensis]|uniref:hypothetical protein n=1 Tax=Streptomyces pratensis TaxID=1169025 RepID=UPI00301A2837
MAEELSAAENGAAPTPAGPFLREYTPTGVFRHSSARTTSVLFYRNGGYSVAGVSGVQHYDKRALARPQTICEIATGTFVATLRMQLPAAGGATFFTSEVDIHWTVEDPHLVAVQVVSDVAQRLNAPVLERLREISSRFPVTQAEQANTAITDSCVSGRWNDLGSDLGLRVRLYVRLRVDDKTIGHVDVIRDERAASQLTSVRQEGFRAMLRGGELDQLSYMLAAEPEAAKDFLEKIRQEGRQDEKDRVDRLFDMVASGQIPSSEMDAQALAYLNRERLSIEGPVGTRPARRAPQELERGRGEPFTPEWVANEPPSRPPRRTARDGEVRDEEGRDEEGRDADVRPRRGRGRDGRRTDAWDVDAWGAGPGDTEAREAEARGTETGATRREARGGGGGGSDRYRDDRGTDDRYADDRYADDRYADDRSADDRYDDRAPDRRDRGRPGHRDRDRRDRRGGDGGPRDGRGTDHRDAEPERPLPRGRARDDGWGWAEGDG